MASGVNQVTSLVADVKGFFKEEGLIVDRRPIARGNIAVEAIASGSMQFAEVSDVVFFSAVTHGIPLIALGDGSRGFTGKMIARPDHRPVKTLADMKGDHIGLQVGTGLQGVFLMLLQKDGLKESDFRISNVRVVDMPTAMASSPPAFDAVLGWDPMMTRIVEAGRGKEVISAEQFQQMAGITYPLLLVAAKGYIDSNHATVQHFVNAYAKALKYIRENPDDALRIYAQAIRQSGATLDEKVIKTMMFEVPKFTGVNIIPSDWTELTRSRDFLFKTGQIQSQPDLKAIIDPSFGDAAEASIK
jgi:sulfonate transport system substrate-binding protein